MKIEDMDRAQLLNEIKKLRNDRQNLEDELRAGREKIQEMKKFEIITNKASYGVVIRDLAGDFVYVNQAYADLHDLHPDDLIGKPVTICHTPKQMKHVEKLGKIREKTGWFISEVDHKKRDGSVFPTMMTGTNIRDDQGNLMYYTSTNH